MTYEIICRLAALTAQQMVALGDRVLRKPIMGGVFDARPYSMATVPAVERGLHAVQYSVIRNDGLPIGFGDSYAAALQSARSFMATWSVPEQEQIFEFVYQSVQKLIREDRDEQRAKEKVREAEWARRDSVPSVPKRRREIFEKSGGKCHYCATPLTLDGTWHIEHKMPRALLGGNETHNLAASCVSCNLKKKDKTDMEFIAQRARESA